MREFWPLLPVIIVLVLIAGFAIRHAERESIRSIREEPTEHGPFQ